jgi:hypothetical protein
MVAAGPGVGNDENPTFPAMAAGLPRWAGWHYGKEQWVSWGWAG